MMFMAVPRRGDRVHIDRQLSTARLAVIWPLPAMRSETISVKYSADDVEPASKYLRVRTIVVCLTGVVVNQRLGPEWPPCT